MTSENIEKPNVEESAEEVLIETEAVEKPKPIKRPGRKQTEAPKVKETNDDSQEKPKNSPVNNNIGGVPKGKVWAIGETINVETQTVHGFNVAIEDNWKEVRLPGSKKSSYTLVLRAGNSFGTS